MANAKYWIYGGRRWREVDTDTGRVDGWGDVSFVYMSRGKLMMGNKQKILRALRKLGIGDRTGAARDGPRLSEKRSYPKVAYRKRTRSCNCHHCPAANKCPIISVQEKPDLPKLTSPKTITANASAQTESNDLNIITRVENNSEISRHRKRKHVISSNETTSHDEADNEPKTVDYNRIITLHSDDDSVKEQPKSNKVLDIDEKDIMMLRDCIENGLLFPDADLIKFDSSDEYKRSLLYQLNPLVYVDRSKEIAEMLKAKNKDNLQKFLATLGLRPINNVKKPKRYRTRHTISQTRGETKDSDSQSLIDDNDKENHATKTLRKKNLSLKRKEVEIPIASNGVNTPSSLNRVTKALEKNRLTEVYDENMLRNRLKVTNEAKITSDSSDSSERLNLPSKRLKITNLPENNLSKVPNRLKVVNSKTVISESDESYSEETSSTEEAEQDVSYEVKTQKKVNVNKPSFSVPKRTDPVTRAYTPAEDRAIVDWVLKGSRARMVNGNTLWRQLEPAYFEITGHARSWQSLRNRYLRYIMPTLQTIAPSHASKLRAASAAGEIKTKNRRHSMFSTPKIGAASRRQPAAKESSPPPRKLRSSPEGPTLRTLRSTQSLDGTGIKQSIHKSLNQSLNRSPHKLRDQLANRSPHKSPNRLTRRSLRNVTIDSDNSNEPLKEVSGEQKNLKRRKLYNP